MATRGVRVERRKADGRRKGDLVKAVARKLSKVERSIDTHLIDCVGARRSFERSLKKVHKHLERQDEDLQIIRGTRKVVLWAVGSLGSFATLLEIIRFFLPAH